MRVPNSRASGCCEETQRMPKGGFQVVARVKKHKVPAQ